MAKEVTRIERGIVEHCLPCYLEEGHQRQADIQIVDPEDEEWKTPLCAHHAEVLDVETYSPYYPANDSRRIGNK